MITLTEPQWAALHARLVRDYQAEPSVMLIRGKMRRTLGFTVRHHREWAETQGLSGRIREWICLDFWEPAQETWFRLKYAEFLP